MHITYDPDHNIGYIRFKKRRGKVARTICLSSDMNIDIAADGSIYGIELMDANNQLMGDKSKLIVENQSNHKLQELRL